MPYFVCKPRVVNAVQYVAADSSNHARIIELLGAQNIAWMNDGLLCVLTDDQWLLAEDGDWVGHFDDNRPKVWDGRDFPESFEPVTKEASDE